MKLPCSRKEGGRSNLAHIKCTTNSYSFSNHDFRMAQVYLMKTSHQRTDLNWKQQIRMGGNGITPLKSKITSFKLFQAASWEQVVVWGDGVGSRGQNQPWLRRYHHSHSSPNEQVWNMYLLVQCTALATDNHDQWPHWKILGHLVSTLMCINPSIFQGISSLQVPQLKETRADLVEESA